MSATDDKTHPAGLRLTLERLLVVALLIAGLVSLFWPTLSSNYNLMQTDPGDTLLNNHALEHSWRWLTRDNAAPAFWSPHIAYPTLETLAYSDLMLSFGPPYWLLRALGLSALTSFQNWMMLVTALNFGAAYLLLRRVFGHVPMIAGFGAYLFVFASPRVHQLAHQQLLPQIYILGAFASLVGWLRPGQGEKERGQCVAVFSLCLCLQFWGSFYLGYFTVLACGLACAFAFCFAKPRCSLVSAILATPPVAAVVPCLCIAALLPLASHYMAVAEEVGMRSSLGSLVHLPRWWTFLNPGPWNWLYGQHVIAVAPLHTYAWLEQALGTGVVATLSLGVAVWRHRGNTGVRIATLVAVVLIGAVTMFPTDLTAWTTVHSLVPGMSAIRAPGRILLLGLLPLALALVSNLEALRQRAGSLIVVVLGLACFAEQLGSTVSFDKVAAESAIQQIAAKVEPDSETFFVIGVGDCLAPWWGIQPLAMLAQQHAGTPTLNLYRGNAPPGWSPLKDNVARTQERLKELEAAAESWALLKGLDPERTQVIYLSDEGVVNDPARVIARPRRAPHECP